MSPEQWGHFMRRKSKVKRRTARNLRITVMRGERGGWYDRHADVLIQRLRRQGHIVMSARTPGQVRKGDALLVMSCYQLLKSQVLAKNLRNIVFHAADLPRGRGWSALTWQVLEGRSVIPLTAFEANEDTDAGPVYVKDRIRLQGHELLPEMHDRLARKMNEVAFRLIRSWSSLVSHAQKGRPIFYAKRTSRDSELSLDRTIRQQFNILRVVDNEAYPAFFRFKGCEYVLKIAKRDQAQGGRA